MESIHSHLVFFNRTVLWWGIQQVVHLLEGPTLVYHDDSNMDTSMVIQSIADSRSVFIVKAPELPIIRLPYKPQSTIFMAANPLIITPKFQNWSMWNARSRILIIVDNSSQIHDWIENLWRLTRAANVLVMLLNETAEFFTWTPYKADECTKVVTLTKLNNSELFSTEIKPPFNNCPLLAVTSPLVPIVVNDMYGMEPRLFHDFAGKLGMNASYVSLPPKSYVWTLFDTTGPINGLKLLKEYKADLMFSQMSIEGAMYFSDFLVPHMCDEMVWFVPGPKLASRASAIYRAFSPLIWMLVIIAYLLLFSLNILVSLSDKPDISGSLIRTLAITCNLPYFHKISQTLSVLFIVAYVYSLHITTAYQSSLMIFLSDSPREKPIKNVKDLAETNLNIEFHDGHEHLVRDLIQSTKEFFQLRQENRIHYTGFLNLTLVNQPAAIALLGPKLAFGYQLLDEDQFYDPLGHPTVLMLPEPVLSACMAFHVALGHPLHPFLNKYLQYLIEAGMPQHYIKESLRPVRPRIRQLEPFGMENVFGPFVLFITLIILSAVSWIIEWAYWSLNGFVIRKIATCSFLSKSNQNKSNKL